MADLKLNNNIPASEWKSYLTQLLYVLLLILLASQENNIEYSNTPELTPELKINRFEVETAVKLLNNRKSPGEDRITDDLLKQHTSRPWLLSER